MGVGLPDIAPGINFEMESYELLAPRLYLDLSMVVWHHLCFLRLATAGDVGVVAIAFAASAH